MTLSIITFVIFTEQPLSCSLAVSSALDPTAAALNNEMTALTVRRQKRLRTPTILKRARRALHDAAEYKQLIGGIKGLLDELEALFPAPSQQADVIRREPQQIHDKDKIAILKDVAREVDERLSRAAAAEAVVGHQYRNVKMKY